MRSLAENIRRGRRAITLARQRGTDTIAWERCLAELERQHLLAWASEFAEQDIMTTEPVTWIEAPLRTVSTRRVSWYAAQYLTTVASSRLHQQTGGWSRWTPDWWQEREVEALKALEALRNVVRGLDHLEGLPDEPVG